MGLLRYGGIEEEQVICVEGPPPADQSECPCVLTDDCVMAHVVRERGSDVGFSTRQVTERVRRFGQAMADNGVQRKIEKDVTCADELTGMGCWLTGNPPRAEPDAPSARRAVLATWGLERSGSVSSGAVAS